MAIPFASVHGEETESHKRAMEPNYCFHMVSSLSAAVVADALCPVSAVVQPTNRGCDCHHAVHIRKK